MPNAGTAYVRVLGDFSKFDSMFAARLAPTRLGKIGKAGGAALVGGLAAAGVGTALYKLGKSFDDAYDTIRVGTGKTGKALEGLRGDFKAVVKDVPTDFKSAGKAIAEINTRLDQTGKPLQDLSKQFLELSRITETDVSENIASVSRAFGDWEVKTKRQGETLDFMFRAAQRSGASVSELATLVVKFGAPLRRFGFDVEQATSMFALFEKAGVNIQTMVPGLKLALSEFLAAGRDPEKALLKTFKGIEDGTIKASDAIDIFGKRAGSDMVEAIEQGRFKFDDFAKAIREGDDTILKAGENTRDFNEHWQLFKQRVFVALEPVAIRFFNAIGAGMEAINKIDFSGAIDSLRTFWQEADVLRAVFSVIGGIISRAVRGWIQSMEGFVQVVEGIVQVISGLLTLNFSRAWQGVKNIFGGGVKMALGLLREMTAPARETAARIGNGLSGPLGKAWNTVKNVFKTGTRAAADAFGWLRDKISGLVDKIKRPIVEMTKPIGRALQWIVDKVKAVIKGFEDLKGKIPDVPDVNLPSPGDIKGIFRQRGGVIVPGTGTGDRVPAMLEPGEVVWNRKAVAAMGGVAAANEANRLVPRFAKGGPIGRPTFSGGNTLSRLAQSGTDRARDSANELLKAAKKASTALGAGKGNLGAVTKLAAKYGNQITSGYRPGDPGWHGKNRARDYAGGNMMAFARAVASAFGKNLLELIYTPLGFSIKNGQRTAPFAQADHYDHVHVAMQKGGTVGRPKYGARWIPGSAASSPMGRKWSMSEAATLLWQVGMSPSAAKQLARKVPGESGGDPRIVSRDGGYGLWQITPRVGNQDAVRRFGGIAAMRTPIPNAKAAKMIYDRQGIGAWYAPSASGTVQILRNMIGKAGGGGGKKTTGRGTQEAKAVDLPAKLKAKIASWTALADKYSEWADRASTIEDKVYGKDEAGWLQRELQAIFTVRNILVAAYLRWQKRIQSISKRIQKLKRKGGMKKHGALIKALRSQRDTLKQRQGLLAEPLKELQGTVPSGVGHRIFGVAPSVGTLGGRIFDIQAKLKGLGADTSAVQDSESADLLRQLLQESQLRNLISERQLPILSKIPEIVGSYATGGVIPGRTGQAQLAQVHSGEGVFTPEQMAAMGQRVHVTVLVEDGAVDPNKIRTVVTDSMRREVSVARRRTQV